MKKYWVIGGTLFVSSMSVNAAPIATVITDRIEYTGISQAYCADVARGAAQARTKKMAHYEVIDVLSAGLDQRSDLPDVVRKAAKRMVTLLVSRVYLDKVSGNAELDALARTECAWSNQLLQGVEALNNAK